jgi:hypothetical protein
MNEREAEQIMVSLTFLTALMLEHGGKMTVKPESIARARHMLNGGDFVVKVSEDLTTAQLRIPESR